MNDDILELIYRVLLPFVSDRKNDNNNKKHVESIKAIQCQSESLENRLRSV